MEFKRSNFRDIEKYFLHTWVKFEEFGDTLFYINRVFNEKITGETQDGDYFEVLLYDEQPYHVNYILPHKAVFQFGNRAALMQRIPAQQYKRGLCQDNTQCIYPDTGTPIDLTIKILLAYTNKTSYMGFSEAFLSKKDKRLSIAVNNRMFCLKKSGGIYVDTTCIARFDYDSSKIYLNKPQFRDEIQNHLNKYHDTLEIV